MIRKKIYSTNKRKEKIIMPKAVKKRKIFDEKKAPTMENKKKIVEEKIKETKSKEKKKKERKTKEKKKEEEGKKGKRFF
jgi:hypothetical protein